MPAESPDPSWPHSHPPSLLDAPPLEPPLTLEADAPEAPIGALLLWLGPDDLFVRSACLRTEPGRFRSAQWTSLGRASTILSIDRMPIAKRPTRE